MMPTFPRSPLSFRTAGFPQYGWKAGFPSGAFLGRQRFKPAPGIRRPTSSLHPPFVRFEITTVVPHSVGSQIRSRTALEVITPPPQRPSLGSGLSCPGPASLNRPHPSHSPAHRDFTARRLIRDAFAVRERRGDPRVVPSFRCTVLPDMPSSPTPGSSVIALSNITMTTRSSPHPNRLDTPNTPAIRFTRGSNYVASLVRNCYGLSGCSSPWSDQTEISPGHRRLLRPGFRQVVRPSRRWI
jgi:hypothetical protein